jgi:undecaprenyl-diphosphatase
MFIPSKPARIAIWVAITIALCLEVLVAVLVSGRLALILAGVALLVGSAVLVTRLIADYVYPSMQTAADFAFRSAQLGDNRAAKWLREILGPSGPELPLLAVSAIVLMGGLWAFFGVLEDVVTGDPLVFVDQISYDAFLQLRSYWGDFGLVAITQLGDFQVVFPVAATGVAIFVALGKRRAAMYLVLAVVGASMWVQLIKLLLQRSRPVDLYAGASQFSFPSGHATMSIVVFGFIAILLAHGTSLHMRRKIIGSALSLILLIGFSRIYLGAHWLSDVVAGLSFGAAWIALLSIAYFRVAPEPLPGSRLFAIFVAVLLGSGAVHVARSHANDLKRYAAAGATSSGTAPATNAAEFWKRGNL